MFSKHLFSFFFLLLLAVHHKRGWDKSPSLSIIFGLSSKTQWLSGLYYADFISFYSPTQLCGGGTTKSNSNELPISVPLSQLRPVTNLLGLSLFFYFSSPFLLLPRSLLVKRVQVQIPLLFLEVAC